MEIAMVRLKHEGTLVAVSLCALLIGCAPAKEVDDGPHSANADAVRDVRLDQPAAYLAFSADGKTLATGTDVICLWDAHSGEKLCEVDADSDTGGRCVYIALSPECSLLATLHRGSLINEPSYLIHLWEVTSDRHLRKARTLLARKQLPQDFGSEVYHVAFSPDGKSLVTGSPDGTITVWNTSNGEERLTFQGGVAASFAPDGKTLVSVSRNGVIRRWKADTADAIDKHTKEEHDEFIFVSKIAFDPSRKRIALSDDYSVCLKDVLSGRTVRRMELYKLGADFAFAPDGSFVIAEGHNGLRLVDAETGAEAGFLRDHSGYAQAVGFSPGRNRVAWSAKDFVVVQAWPAVASQIQENWVPLNEGDTRSPLRAQLLANQDTYELDLGHKTAEEFNTLVESGRRQPTPKVDLAFQLRNTGSQPVSIRTSGYWDVLDLHLLGDNGLNYQQSIGQTGVQPFERTVSLAPGETYSFPVTSLNTRNSRAYWLLPGEYTICASCLIWVSPPPAGKEAGADGFALVDFRAAPVKVKVKAAR
jgi:hypothetical protein